LDLGPPEVEEVAGEVPGEPVPLDRPAVATGLGLGLDHQEPRRRLNPFADRAGETEATHPGADHQVVDLFVRHPASIRRRPGPRTGQPAACWLACCLPARSSMPAKSSAACSICQSLRARKTGWPRWSSAMLISWATQKRSIKRGVSASIHRAVMYGV